MAEGVYAAVGNGTIQTQDTVAVVDNRDDVLLVDTNITPEATRRLVSDIHTLTDKPIRYVPNTRFLLGREALAGVREYVWEIAVQNRRSG